MKFSILLYYFFRLAVAWYPIGVFTGEVLHGLSKSWSR